MKQAIRNAILALGTEMEKTIRTELEAKYKNRKKPGPPKGFKKPKTAKAETVDGQPVRDLPPQEEPPAEAVQPQTINSTPSTPETVTG